MPSHGPPIRYAIYTRQSVERPTDFSSCDAQFDNCQSFIDQRKNESLAWVSVRFDDEGESGGTLDRPAMNRLRKLVQSRGVDRIYVTALDRLAREVGDDELAEEVRQLAWSEPAPDAPHAASVAARAAR